MIPILYSQSKNDMLPKESIKRKRKIRRTKLNHIGITDIKRKKKKIKIFIKLCDTYHRGIKSH